MKRFRLGVVLASLFAPLAVVTAAPQLSRLVPATAPVVLHVRSIADLRAGWAGSSHARAWQDPEIRKFLAPLIASMNDGEEGFAAELRKDTGMTPEEFFALFSGEAIFAIKDLGPISAGEDAAPRMFFAVDCGDSAGKVKALITAAAEKSREEGETEVEEEFQGETLHVTVAEEDGARVEKQAWALVSGVFMVGEPKVVLQEAIVAIKKGGVADPIADHPALAGLYRKSPDTHVVMHVGLDSIISMVVSMLESTAGQTDDEGNPTGPAAKLAQLGLTPQGLFHTLGLDALRSLDSSVTFRERETVVEGDLAWTEQRGLLRLAAMGEPPVARPEFIPDSWVSAGVDNFSLPRAYTALMETLAEVSPAIHGMVRQQIMGMNAQLKIDLDRDVFGSFGDVMVSGYAVPADGPSPDQPLDQFVGIALANPTAFQGAIDALIGATPLGQMLQSREYLGETIRTVALPTGKSFSFAITRGYLLVVTGGPAMVESAIQGLRGDTPRSFWKKPEAAKALAALPDGASSILVADMGRMLGLVVDFVAQQAATAAAADAGSDEEGEGKMNPLASLVDPSARPSPETIAKYWSMASRGIYRSPNGFHLILKMEHGR